MTPWHYGRVQCWLVPPWQSQMINWVPSAELPPLASRHLPDCALTSELFAPGVHRWPLPPLQPNNCTGLPFAVALALMHLPSERSVPSEPTVHCWLDCPLQVHSWIFVPSVVDIPLTSTHLPATPVIRPTRGAVPPSSLIRMLRKDTSSPVPWFWIPMKPSASDRAGSVLVKSLILTPFRNTCRFSPCTSSS